MTVSIRRMKLGDGYRYLIESVARGDGTGDPSSPLTRYYAQLSDTVAAALQEIVAKRGDVRATLGRFEDEWNGKYAGN